MLEVYEKNDETFNYLMSTLNYSIREWNYFVDWTKVQENARRYEVELNILNYLIGKTDVKSEFKTLIEKYPSVLLTIPLLIASRDKNFDLLNATSENPLNTVRYTFDARQELTQQYLNNVVEFVDKSGVLELFSLKKIKNVVDYVFGIEVGLDSNGRKNRSGTAMESYTESKVKQLCERYGMKYFTQVGAEQIEREWGYTVTVDKSSRRFDFAINTGKSLVLIETNYYGGGGSKLKATAGEYKSLFDLIKRDGHSFVWITDGQGWNTAHLPLRETFNHNDYIINLRMIEDGLLEKVVIGI